MTRHLHPGRINGQRGDDSALWRALASMEGVAVEGAGEGTCQHGGSSNLHRGKAASPPYPSPIPLPPIPFPHTLVPQRQLPRGKAASLDTGVQLVTQTLKVRTATGRTTVEGRSATPD